MSESQQLTAAVLLVPVSVLANANIVAGKSEASVALPGTPSHIASYAEQLIFVKLEF